MTASLARLNAVEHVPEQPKPRVNPGAQESVRRFLREATRTEHQLLDRAMSNFALADSVDYSAFLIIHCTALNALAGRWRNDDEADFSSLLLCVVDDLRTLGHQALYRSPSDRVKADSLRQWGVAYVIRGSRLGARILRQRVPASYPTSYLDHESKVSWSDFAMQLDDAAASLPGGRDHILRGAQFAFAAFSAAVGRSND